MLLYALIASPGYYIQNGSTILVAMFAVLLMMAIMAFVVQLRCLLTSFKTK